MRIKYEFGEYIFYFEISEFGDSIDFKIERDGNPVSRCEKEDYNVIENRDEIANAPKEVVKVIDDLMCGRKSNKTSKCSGPVRIPGLTIKSAEEWLGSIFDGWAEKIL